MIDKPLYFCVLNFVSFFLILSIGGFSSAFPLSIAISVFVILYNSRLVGIENSLVLGIIYLLAFDSTVFYFGIANIRIWYIYLILVYTLKIILRRRDFFRFEKNILEYLCLIFLLGLSIYYLVVEDLITKVNNLKYWGFYVGLILVLNDFFRKNISDYSRILNYLISISSFIMLWGLFQFFTNLQMISNFQLDYFNLRPSGFFSETTWYSEFTFFGLLLIFLKVLTDKNNVKLLFLVPLYVLGFMASVTRNTFLACALYLFLSFILSIFIEKKIYLNISKSRVFQVFGGTVVVLITYLLIKMSDIAAFFSGKFDGQDGSAQGRIEAYKISINRIFNSDLLGNGFYWDFSHSTSSGSALGAKSFNLFLMMGHIFGPFGFFVFMLLIFVFLMKVFLYYFKYKSIYMRYSIIVLLLFIQMSMFAPLHQYPFGMMIVSISVFLYNIGIYEKNNIYYSSV